MTQETIPTRSRSEVRASTSGAAFKVWDALSEMPARNSLSDIERATGLSRTSVVNALKELEAAELLSRIAFCPKCNAKRAATECLQCGSHEPPNYDYRLMGIAIAALLGAAALLAPTTAHAAAAHLAQHFPDQAHAVSAIIRKAIESSLSEPSAENELPSQLEAVDVSRVNSRQDVVQKNYQVAPKVFIDNSIKTKERTLGDKQKIWYEETKSMAEHSARLIGDTALGVHINAWVKARKHKLREELVQIVLVCEQQRQTSKKPQGRAFSFLTQQLFQKHGLAAPSAEQLAIRATLDIPDLAGGAA